MAYIEFSHVHKEYGSGESLIKALDDAHFIVEKGELAVILGSSGAGKTTALNILGGMDRATRGNIIVDGKDLSLMNRKELIGYRRHDIGFVFQFYNLVPNLTALENVELAVHVSKHALDPVETLRRVGLGERMGNFPSQLSGGEQQRVSIARAIAKNPKLLLCDEPTGALDYNTSREILRLIERISLQYRTTIIMVTHNEAIGAMADTVIRLRDGRIRDRVENAARLPAEQLEW